MEINITATPEFNFVIDKEEIRMLMKMSKHHYDSVCQSMSKEGGKLYGRNNCIVHFGLNSVSCSWRDLDIICKICENSMFLQEWERDHVRAMVREFHKAFSAARQLSDISIPVETT